MTTEILHGKALAYNCTKFYQLLGESPIDSLIMFTF